jgi:hypothetical protein
VETLDADGAPLAAGVTYEGNYALCHWFYGTRVLDAGSYDGGIHGADNWGETRYLNEHEWGTSGYDLTGSVIQTTGTRITDDGNPWGFTLDKYATMTTYVA